MRFIAQRLKDTEASDIAHNELDGLNEADYQHVTAAQKTVVENTSGANTGDETQSTIKTKLGAASSGVDGYLGGADWITFNGKQNTLVPVTINAGNLSATAAMCLNGYIEITSAGEVELPTGVQGMAVTVRASGAFAVSIDPAGVEVIVLNGTALTGGNKITSTSAANDTATLIHNGTNWVVIGPSVWTDGGA